MIASLSKPRQRWQNVVKYMYQSLQNRNDFTARKSLENNKMTINAEN